MNVERVIRDFLISCDISCLGFPDRTSPVSVVPMMMAVVFGGSIFGSHFYYGNSHVMMS